MLNLAKEFSRNFLIGTQLKNFKTNNEGLGRLIHGETKRGLSCIRNCLRRMNNLFRCHSVC